MSTRAWIASAVLLLAGCGDDGVAPPVAGCEPGAFVGDWTTIAFHPDGSVDAPVPRDLTGFTFSALVSTDTGTVELPGTVHLGGFRIPGVPDARPITIKVEASSGNRRYLITDGCRWDSGIGILERGVSFATEPATQLVLDVAGLAPWNRGHTITAFFPDLWDVFWLDAPTATGATMGTGFRDESSTWPLLTIADAQPSTIFQSSSTTLDGEPRGYDLVADTPPLVETLIASGELPPFALAEGSETTASVTLAPLVADRTISVGIDGDAFAALLPDVRAPEGDPVNLFVQPSPGLGCEPAPSLVRLSTPASGRAVLDAHAYADPFPAAWDRLACITFSATSQDAVWPQERGVLEQGTYLEEVEGTLIVPTVSFARSWTIGGQDPWEPGGPIGLTPTVAWEAPALGDRYAYRVSVYTSRSRAEIQVDADLTSFVLPEGVLQPGDAAAFFLTARGDEGSTTLTSTQTLSP